MKDIRKRDDMSVSVCLLLTLPVYNTKRMKGQTHQIDQLYTALV